LHKFMFDISDMAHTLFLAASGSLPFDTIAAIACYNEKLWIMSTDNNDIEVAHYNGYVWTDLTAQFFSNTGITIVEETFKVILYKMFCDQSGNLLFTLNQNSATPGNLFVYTATTEAFTIKAIPGDFTKMHDFVKIADTIYAIDHATEKSAGKQIIFSFSLGTVHYKATNALVNNIVTDGKNVIAYSPTNLLNCVVPSVIPKSMTDYLAELEDLLEDSQKIHIVNIFPAVNKFAILNIASTVNTIIENKLTPRWVIK